MENSSKLKIFLNELKQFSNDLKAGECISAGCSQKFSGIFKYFEKKNVFPFFLKSSDFWKQSKAYQKNILEFLWDKIELICIQKIVYINIGKVQHCLDTFP